MLEIWVLEYSASEDAFHSSRLIDSVDSNRRTFVANVPRDYVVVAMATSRDALDIQASPLREIRNRRLKEKLHDKP